MDIFVHTGITLVYIAIFLPQHYDHLRMWLTVGVKKAPMFHAYRCLHRATEVHSRRTILDWSRRLETQHAQS